MRSRILGYIAIVLFFLLPAQGIGQRLVDWNKGDHNNTKKGFMDGNLVSTVYYNFGEGGDYLNEKNRSGVWPKGSQPPHTYLDGVAIIVQAETEDPYGNLIHPLESNYYELRDMIRQRASPMAGGHCQDMTILNEPSRPAAMIRIPGRSPGRTVILNMTRSGTV